MQLYVGETSNTGRASYTVGRYLQTGQVSNDIGTASRLGLPAWWERARHAHTPDPVCALSVSTAAGAPAADVHVGRARAISCALAGVTGPDHLGPQPSLTLPGRISIRISDPRNLETSKPKPLDLIIPIHSATTRNPLAAAAALLSRPG